MQIYANRFPEQLHYPTATAIREVLTTDTEYEIVSAYAGHIYTRKNEQCVDLFGQPRNKSYGSGSDDVVLSVTIRLPFRRPGLSALDRLQAAAVLLDRAKLDAEIAAAEKAAADALEHAQQLRTQRAQHS